MNHKKVIHSASAPAAIGTYSQAIQTGNLVFISGQIPLDPNTMVLVSENIEAQVHQVFKNLTAVINAAGGKFSDAIKLTVYLTDLKNFAKVNEIMAEYVPEPYPARVAVGVKELPKGAEVEIDAIIALQN